jgi:hypothetical protein
VLQLADVGQVLVQQPQLRQVAGVAGVAEAMDAHTVLPFAIPHDFTDGFQTAYWRRPEMFLNPVLRQSSSTFAQLPATVVEPAMARLRADLASGAWHRRHADLLEQDSVDYDYRLLIADSAA